MLKNLYKHELRALFRTLLPVYGVLLLLSCSDAVLLKVFGDTEGFAIKAATIFILIFYFLTIAAAAALTAVAIFQRFYKNCFGREGYLTFSLPFTAGQHLTCKLLCAVAVEVATGLVILGTGAILMVTQLDMSILWNAFRSVFSEFASYVEPAQLVLSVLTVAAGLVSGILLYYFCIAFGQRFKSRLGGAVATFFILRLIGNFLAIAGSSIMTYCMEKNLFNNFSPRFMAYMALLGSLLWQVILLMVFLYGTWHELDRKLNLA